MTAFNGYKNWNHWNVSIWINNDERLYRIAQYCIKVTGNRARAVNLMLWELQSTGQTHTKDGALYSKSAIRAAMAGM
jgi:hypothetical protein